MVGCNTCRLSTNLICQMYFQSNCQSAPEVIEFAQVITVLSHLSEHHLQERNTLMASNVHPLIHLSLSAKQVTSVKGRIGRSLVLKLFNVQEKRGRGALYAKQRELHVHACMSPHRTVYTCAVYKCMYTVYCIT